MDITLALTTPRGLYFVALAITVLLEVVIGVIEIAAYFGLLPF